MTVTFKKSEDFLGKQITTDKVGNTETFYMASLKVPVTEANYTETEKADKEAGKIEGVYVNSEYSRIEEIVAIPYLANSKTDFTKQIDGEFADEIQKDADNKDIYVIGGQTSTKTDAKALKNVYVYHTESKQWQKKADMKEGRTNLSTAVCDKKVYAFSKAGATDRVDVYDMNTDTWETTVMPGTSTILGAAAVDNRVFVLKEKESSLFFEEYLPEENTWEEPGTVCPYTVSDRFAAPVVIRGKIYLVKESETKDVYVYDAYLDEWSEVSAMNLKKQESVLAACGNELYSIGGEMTGFGVLDVVEQYTVKVQTTKKQMEVRQGSHYELQINAGNLKKGQSKVVTISVNPKELEIQNASSFAEEDDLKEGAEGVTLLKYQPKKGVMVWKLTGSLERGESCETYQSIPVEAKKDGKTEIAYTMTEQS